MISVFDRVEKIVGKGEIACASNFFFSHSVFKRLLSQTRQKVSLCGNELKPSFLVDDIASFSSKPLLVIKFKAFWENKPKLYQLTTK